MTLKPEFPSKIHQEAAQSVRDYFMATPGVDTVLVVNSCARAQAVPESDLDLAILIKPELTATEKTQIECSWKTYMEKQPIFLNYTQSGPFAHLHVDIIDGKYSPGTIGNGEPIDYFEIEIGNQIVYSLPMDHAGGYFKELQGKWLPYYNEGLRLQRLMRARNACEYDLDHIPFFVKRELYFHAFYILCKAFEKYLQTLFIANSVYPIAYNKWIKEQIVKWLNLPGLYPKLPSILSISTIESKELIEKAGMLRKLLDEIKINSVNDTLLSDG